MIGAIGETIDDAIGMTPALQAAKRAAKAIAN